MTTPNKNGGWGVFSLTPFVAALSAEFEDALTTTEIESCIHRIETAIKVAHPSVTGVFIKPQTQEVWAHRIANLSDRETLNH